MRKMKDSGVEWIGEMPPEWNVIPLKFLLKAPLQYGASEAGVSFDPELPRYIRITDIDGKGRIKTEGALSLPLEGNETYVLNPEDILFARSGASVGKTLFFGDKEPVSVFAGYLIRASIDSNKVPPKFVYYFTLSEAFSTWKNLAYSQATIQNISADNYRELLVPVPPRSLASKIVGFLDAKYAEIDALTADIEEQIETLQKYKQSVITEAVTKGLDPDAPMKDSGFEWVGRVPSTWRMLKGKYLFKQRNQRGNSIELQLLSPTQRFGVVPQPLYEELSGMNAVKLNEKTDLGVLKTIHKGDFCISLRSFQGGFEYSEYEGVVSPAYQVFYPSGAIEDTYYRYLFKDAAFITKMNSYTMTLRDGKNIAFEDFGNTYIPYPPVAEQHRIGRYLDAKCDEIDGIIVAKREQIETLAEYKKSLIFEYVTGKKEVPAK